MSDPSNMLTVGSSSQISAAALSGPAASSSAPRPPTSPTNVITYSYASRLVYVAPAETYDDAIDIAKESFRELKDVERERISFEVKVNLVKTQQSRTAEIGRTAWPNVVASLARFEIVEIRVAPFPCGQAGVAGFSSQASGFEPPPYAPEKSGYLDSQTNATPYGSQIASSQSPSPPFFVTRIINFFTPKSSRPPP